jgi:uncharacterized caspase-like protein
MSYRSFTIAAALALSAWASMGTALAENRIALVIGNSKYETVTALPNPANDAKAMTDLLIAAGFEIVSEPDLTQGEMRRTIADFAARLKTMGRDTVALVFYAGHGLQVDGENYLAPIDVNLRSEADVPLQAVRLADLMNALATAPSKTRIVMLDSCRNNPFSEINKTSGRGLAIVDAPTGSIVSYSTAPGAEAEDGDGVNSPYTGAVLTIAKERGLAIEQALKRVRGSVHQTTKGRQTPWESSSLTGDFFFFPGEAKPAAKAGATAQPTAAGGKPSARSVDSWRKELQSRSAREAYDIIIREDTVEAYQAYLALYPRESVTPRVREILDRRRLMIAWYVAVTADTPAAYQAFLASYPNSDFALTAQRLLDRASSRSLAGATQLAAACSCPEPTPGKTRRTETKQEKRTASRSTRKRSVDDDEPRVIRGSAPQGMVPAGGQAAGPVISPALIGIGVGIGSRFIGPRHRPSPTPSGPGPQRTQAPHTTQSPTHRY